jgi:hypothetical protein
MVGLMKAIAVKASNNEGLKVSEILFIKSKGR